MTPQIQKVRIERVGVDKQTMSPIGHQAKDDTLKSFPEILEGEGEPVVVATIRFSRKGPPVKEK